MKNNKIFIEKHNYGDLFENFKRYGDKDMFYSIVKSIENSASNNNIRTYKNIFSSKKFDDTYKLFVSDTSGNNDFFSVLCDSILKNKNKEDSEYRIYYPRKTNVSLLNEKSSIQSNKKTTLNGDPSIFIPMREIRTHQDMINILNEFIVNDSISSALFKDSKIFSQNDTEISKKIRDIEELGRLTSLLVVYTTESKIRMDFGETVCKKRAFEGGYINESLTLLRENIKDISVVKNRSVVFYSPDFENTCLNDYCPSNDKCFQLENKFNDGENIVIKSPIFQYMYDYLNNDNKYNIEKFYNDIVICVFCVFNISKGANNPPPVPYIDINDLKYHNDRYISLNTEFDKESCFDRLEELNSDLQGDDFVQIKDMIKNINRDMNREIIIDRINKIINQISNNNDATSIGTLEFTDKIGKLNTTNNICYSDFKFSQVVEL
jgi:hypothetical protein